LSHESNDLLALQNAVAGVLSAADRVREVAPAVTSLNDVDLGRLHDAALAHAIAAQALRGYVEELRRRQGA
jgi:hypothetical protein